MSAKLPWSDVEDYFYDDYFTIEAVEYDDGEIITKGCKIGLADTEEFVNNVDISSGIRIPAHMDAWNIDDDSTAVIALDSSAFLGLESLTHISLPEGLLVIGADAFEDCDNLSGVELPSSLKCIEPFSFFSCKKLTSIIFPNNLQVIGYHAFGYTGLRSVILNPSIKKVGDLAFGFCKDLETVIIMNPYIDISSEAFSGCSSLKTVIAPLKLAPQLLNCFADDIDHISFSWTISPNEECDNRKLSVQVTDVRHDHYTDNTSGVTVRFNITNKTACEYELSGANVYLINTNEITLQDCWLSDFDPSDASIAPHETISCAAVFESKSSDAFELLTNFKIAISLYESDDNNLFGRGDCDAISGEWVKDLQHLNNSDGGVIVCYIDGIWKTCMSLLPEITVADVETEVGFENFVVRVNLFKCNHDHHIESICALVSILHLDGSITRERISAGYCRECDCYFILEPDFFRLQKCGVLLCHLITEEEYRTKGDSILSGQDMKAQSVLRRCGYTVNAKDDLSDQQRQGILVQVVESGLYSANEVASFLDWLTDYHGRSKTRDMSSAIEKWRADRHFIINYKIGSRRTVGIGSIRSKR